MSSITKKNKKNKKNKTNKYKKKLQVNNYTKKFKNTKLIPNTQILKYIKDNYKSYLLFKEESTKQDKNVIYLDDCFDFGNSLKSNEKIFTIETSIPSNPNMSLDKLISYSFYIKTPYAFIDGSNNLTSEKFYLETLKYQMGKDIRRDNRTINSKEYNSEIYANEDLNNYNVTDMFYQNLITYYSKFSDNINFNILNKIALLSCQNMFNLITDLVSIKLNEILKPELNSVFRPIKSAIIQLSKDKKTMEYLFDSQLIISRDGEPIDPEYPCGNLLFHLLFDFEKNTYYFTKFKLDYNINKCGPDIDNNNYLSLNSQNMNGDENNNNNNNNTISSSLKYAIPVTLGIGGIVSTPFILGALGGKNKMIKNKTNKNIKNKKKDKNNTILYE